MSTDLSMYRGDDQDFTITMTEAGSAMDLSGAVVRFCAKRNVVDLDADAVITKTSQADEGIAIDGDPTTGIAVVTIDAADTEDLAGTCWLKYDVQVVRGGKTKTVVTGTLEIRADVSRTSP